MDVCLFLLPILMAKNSQKREKKKMSEIRITQNFQRHRLHKSTRLDLLSGRQISFLISMANIIDQLMQF